MGTVRRLLVLGRCMRCMRTALYSAVTCSVVALLSAYFELSNVIKYSLDMGAVAFWILWVAHVISFAVRNNANLLSEPQEELQEQYRFKSRRVYIGGLARLSILAALATASPALAQSCDNGRAWCSPKNGCCAVGQKCCCSGSSTYCEAKGSACIC